MRITRHLTQAHKDHIAIKHFGKKHKPATKLKIRTTMLGHTVSSLTRKRMSAFQAHRKLILSAFLTHFNKYHPYDTSLKISPRRYYKFCPLCNAPITLKSP